MEASQELLDQLFPEPSEADRLVALATRLEHECVLDERGMTHVTFKLVGSVPIGKKGGSTKSFVRRGADAIVLIRALAEQVAAQYEARTRASKGSKRRVRKGGAK